jgi:uncharacterized protein YutE (UPF0331/DUF86 family)
MIVNKSEDRFVQFMNGLAAATQLLIRAGQKGFFIEYVCLATAVIDASLRAGLVLQYQIEKQTVEIPQKLIYQGKEEKGIPEREIYKQALKQGIIDRELYADLENLYIERNKVIHRYIISDITTDRVLQIATQYERIIPIISEAIEKLEEKQIELGVGMTSSGSEDISVELKKMRAKKHRDPSLIRELENTQDG